MEHITCDHVAQWLLANDFKRTLLEFQQELQTVTAGDAAVTADSSLAVPIPADAAATPAVVVSEPQVTAAAGEAPLSITAPAEAQPVLVTGEYPPWTEGERGFDSDSGDEDDLYDPELFTSPLCPDFKQGAGVTNEEFGSMLEKEIPVNMVPYTPFVKPLPPTGLPLESFELRVIYESGRTGFEDVKEFAIVVGAVIAGRYQIVEFLGSAAFSRAVQCIDLKHNVPVCVKIIRNSKDFFDQALDEIKLLQLINSQCDPDEKHVLQLFDYFYFKEHVFLVCELLRDNLYEFSKFNREKETEQYFNLARVQSVAKQVLTALQYVHSLNLLHCDLKPENILVKSYSRCEIKVIDFGSSCFTTDNLSSYVQSRCYRAPEVVLGAEYDGRIDIWSLGCILTELLTGQVLFQNDSLAQMLCRISAILGPFPRALLHNGRHTSRYVTKYGVFYERQKPEDTADGLEHLVYYFPKRTTLAACCGSDDRDFVDFIRQCLELDQKRRPFAGELLQHPFITKSI